MDAQKWFEENKNDLLECGCVPSVSQVEKIWNAALASRSIPVNEHHVYEAPKLSVPVLDLDDGSIQAGKNTGMTTLEMLRKHKSARSCLLTLVPELITDFAPSSVAMRVAVQRLLDDFYNAGEGEDSTVKEFVCFISKRLQSTASVVPSALEIECGGHLDITCYANCTDQHGGKCTRLDDCDRKITCSSPAPSPVQESGFTPSIFPVTKEIV